MSDHENDSDEENELIQQDRTRLRSGRNSDPRRQRLLEHMRRGSFVQETRGMDRRMRRQIAEENLRFEDRQPYRRVEQPEQVPGDDQQVDGSIGYRQAYQQAQGTLDRALQLQVDPPSLPGGLRKLAGLVQRRRGAEEESDWVTAASLLDQSLAIARPLLLAQELQRRSPQEKLAAQKAQYDEIAPTLKRVQNACFPIGGADAISKERLSPGKEFKAYIGAVKKLEAAKKQNALEQGRVLAQEVQEAAELYLAHYANDLSERQQNHPESKRKKQICEEGLKAARQYAMALEMQSIGAPTQNRPWSDEQQLRATQLRAQFGFETGYQKAKRLGNGQEGRNQAYFLSATEFSEEGKVSKSTFIFKPVDHSKPDTLKEATRESVGFANAQNFARQTGLDLSIPESAVVTIGSHALDLSPQDPQGPRIGSVQKFANSSGGLAEQGHGIFSEISAGECHKAALADIINLQMDRTDENFLVDRGEDGQQPPKLISIDNGLSLPDLQKWQNGAREVGGFHSVNGRPPSQLLLMPGTFEKFSPDMVDRLALLDPTAMANGMRTHVQSLDRVSPGLNATQQLPEESIELSRRVMILLKKAAVDLSPGEIMIAISKFSKQLGDFDQDPEQLAERIVAEQKPLGAAYREIMTEDLGPDLVGTLKRLGWTPAHELMLANPVAALRLARAGIAREDDADPVEVSSNLDMFGIVLPKLVQLRQNITEFLDLAQPDVKPRLVQTWQDIPNEDPTTEPALVDLQKRIIALEGEVLLSASRQIRQDVIDLRNQNENSFENEDKSAFARLYSNAVNCARADRSPGADRLHEALELLRQMREMIQNLHRN